MKAGKHYIGLGVGAVIFDKQGRIFLMKRSSHTKVHRTTGGMWSVPGGEVDFAETCEQAVKREIKEELGIDIKVIKLIGYTDQILKQAQVHWHSMHFLCQIISGKPKILEPKKCDQIRWFNPHKLPPNCGIAHVIRPLYLLGKISQAEYNKRIKTTPES